MSHELSNESKFACSDSFATGFFTFENKNNKHIVTDELIFL